MLTLSNSDKLIKIKEQLAKANCSAPMGGLEKDYCIYSIDRILNFIQTEMFIREVTPKSLLLAILDMNIITLKYRI